MRCAEIREQELLERYIACSLSGDEQAAVELHFFECAQCFEELETLRAIQQELTRLPEPRPSGVAIPFYRRRSAWALAAAAALVVAVLVLWSLGLHAPKPPGPPVAGIPAATTAPSTSPTTAPSTSPTTAASSPSTSSTSSTRSTPSTPSTQPATPPAQAVPPEKLARLRELARIEPPAYAPTQLRGPADEAQRLFRQAMQHYQQRNYEAAIPGLQQAAVKNPEAANIAFFLGACDLLTGRTAEGEARLRGVAARGDTPYREESLLLLARACLARGDANGAAARLRAAIALRGDREVQARKLLASLEAAQKSPAE